MTKKNESIKNKLQTTAALISKASTSIQSTFMDTPIEAFLLLDGNLNIVSLNYAGQKLLNVSEEDVMGKCILDVMPDIKKAGIYGKCRLVLKTGKHFVTHSMFGDIDLGMKAFKLGSGLGISVSDITERKLVERERERLLAELFEKTKELEQIIYVTSHDLRSPLVNIQGFTRELAEAFKQVHEILDSKAVSSAVKKKLAPLLDEDIPSAFQYILASSSKMDSLLSGLLRLSRLGCAILNIKRLDMNKLMSQVVSSFEFQIREAGVIVKVEELPPCSGDETQLNQVFSNLLDNALKFLSPGSPGLIRISGVAEEGRVIYCVEDNGIGIENKDKERIFEIFCRLDPDAWVGEGLGLTIVRKILDRHGAKVWVESKPGKGSRFFVSLPTKEGINDKK